MSLLSLFRRQLSFQPIDPMADGLGDDIAVEQSEPEHFELAEQLDMSLAEEWEQILTDARKDPDFTYVSGE